jgi:hypothetical protein
MADGCAVLSVADSGNGIAPEHLPYVFDRSYKVDPARAAAGAGSGLGLSIEKAIVVRHGGTIAVANAPGSMTSIREHSGAEDRGTRCALSRPVGVRRFTDLRAWQACNVYKNAVCRLCEQGPLSKDWTRRGQLEEAVFGHPDTSLKVSADSTRPTLRGSS